MYQLVIKNKNFNKCESKQIKAIFINNNNNNKDNNN